MEAVVILQLVEMITNNHLHSQCESCQMTSVPVTVFIIRKSDFDFDHPDVGRRGYHRPLNVGLLAAEFWPLSTQGRCCRVVDGIPRAPGMIMIYLCFAFFGGRCLVMLPDFLYGEGYLLAGLCTHQTSVPKLFQNVSCCLLSWTSRLWCTGRHISAQGGDGQRATFPDCGPTQKLIGCYTWRIIPSKFLGWFPFQMTFLWLINGR